MTVPLSCLLSSSLYSPPPALLFFSPSTESSSLLRVSIYATHCTLIYSLVMSVFPFVSRRDSDGWGYAVPSRAISKRSASYSTAESYLAACLSQPALMERLPFTASSATQHASPAPKRRANSHVYAPSAALCGRSEDGSLSELSVVQIRLLERHGASLKVSVPQRQLAQVATANRTPPPSGSRQKLRPLPPLLPPPVDTCEAAPQKLRTAQKDAHGARQDKKEGAAAPAALKSAPEVPPLNAAQLDDVDANCGNTNANVDMTCVECTQPEAAGEEDSAADGEIDGAGTGLPPAMLTALRVHTKKLYWSPMGGRPLRTRPSVRRCSLVCFTESTKFTHVCKAQRRQ
ncbi:hypothetical protein STCU_10247 [Strigomonas culicis]|uniref:Uncharacterized protein n=1 Tax=Strigomonas culicis TaxID=28005 RepID=S9V561_9TRYP|nr:hypothetical protein STCU_10247 [Strigomonas culicis]|eukprot:EPY18020.1 hypothetical protein STCU_10247 [Strigomonas culicis]